MVVSFKNANIKVHRSKFAQTNVLYVAANDKMFVGFYDSPNDSTQIYSFPPTSIETHKTYRITKIYLEEIVDEEK